MDAYVDNCIVTGYESLMENLHLPDPKDRHVLAAAIKAGASFIVTFNLKDFPQSVLEHHKIKALTPDEFVLRLIEKDAHEILKIVKHQRGKLITPPKTVEQYLATLEQQRLPKTVAFLREHQDEI